MAVTTYPQPHFVGTPKLGMWVVEYTIEGLGLDDKWIVPLEVIARYESDWDPYAFAPGGAAGLMGMSGRQIASYVTGDPDQNVTLDHLHDAFLQIETAVQYITSRLTGFGGYELLGKVDGIKGLLPRIDRGPGEVLRTWIDNPTWNYTRLRPFYHGY